MKGLKSMNTIETGKHQITVTGMDSRFTTALNITHLEEGLDLVHIKVESGAPEYPPLMKISWQHPAVDIHAFWHPGTDRNKGFQVDWGQGYQSKATSLAPVGCLYSIDGSNRLTFALSDALNPMELKAGIHEESSEFDCSITIFTETSSPFKTYEVTLRLDTRDLPYYQSLNDIQKWWASLPGYQPSKVPDAARLPMYSTWYSFHQRLNPKEVEKQCLFAKDLGCEAVIVDDGWQTSNNERGYAYCGDWEVCAEKIPDMKAHVKAVHDIGMKYILWYSVPFVGQKSIAWSKFSNKLLYTIESLGAGVLDPRFPEVREYIIQIYEKALREWDLDGFKLDFVDSFRMEGDHHSVIESGGDYDSVPVAVDRLLTDVMDRLRKIKPDIMIEFRQSYIGPLMRKYGNMFRAGDCPNDAIQNRVRTLDIRLLSGKTATHSDMMMWNVNEPVESAALQLINVLFSVPQVSVMLDKIPKPHQEMVRFWLSFWKKHQDVLLDGDLIPHQPELLYPLVFSKNEQTQIAAVYSECLVRLGKLPNEVVIVNGTKNDRVIVELEEEMVSKEMIVQNTQGQIISQKKVDLAKGLHAIKIPAAGLVTFR